MNPLITTEKTAGYTEKHQYLPKIPLTKKEAHILSSFDKATPLNWEDWQWQIRNRITTKKSISRFLKLSCDEEMGIDEVGAKLAMSITPYFLSLIDTSDVNCPIRKQCIPTHHEMTVSEEEMNDPCGEDKNSPLHGLVHRYPDRVLFLVNQMCAMYCRFCTRSRMVGEGKHTLNKETFQKAFDYIRSDKNIRDVLISGGDPLMLGDTQLDYIIKNIKAIPHVEFVRIGTRIPVSLPHRITPQLVSILKKYGPVWMSIHFNHYSEITKRVEAACNMLADNGIPLGSQTVLLKGVNNDLWVMKKLVHELLKIRVRPYYLYQCDPITGSKHFRTSLSEGLKIIEQLAGHTSGYAVPTFVVDAPGGGGKIIMGPNNLVSSNNGEYVLKNYEGKHYIHRDPR